MKDILVKYLLGECDAQETREIKQLLEKSPEFRKEYDDLKKVWQASNQANIHPQPGEIEAEMEKYLLKIDELRQKEIASSHFQANKKIDLKFILKIAAVILISIGIGSLATYLAVSGNQKNYSDNLVHQVIAPKGSKSISILPDGTKVWLNAGTILRYSSNYGLESRNVELEGEAYFKVVTNPQKPFTVITSELTIKATGTAFNVKAYPDEKVITTTLEEGKVSISGKGIDITLKPKQNIIYKKRALLKADTTVNDPKKQIEKKSASITEEPKFNMLTNINTLIYTAWKDDQWIIESETLPEVAVLLERKFNVKVQIESDELLKYKFRGTFTNETLEQILNVFRFTAPMEYKINKGIVIIKLDKNRKSKYLEIIKE